MFPVFQMFTIIIYVFSGHESNEMLTMPLMKMHMLSGLISLGKLRPEEKYYNNLTLKSTLSFTISISLKCDP